MKNFTKLVEQLESKKYFKVICEIHLVYEAENEGQCGYMADSDLASVESNVNHSIENILEISKQEYDEFTLLNQFNESISEFMSKIDKNTQPSDKLKMAWENRGNIDKYEFYHEMRSLGYDPNVIKNSIKIDW